MSRKQRLIVSALAGACAVLLLLLAASDGASEAVYQARSGPMHTQLGAGAPFTAYLPLSMSWHDPSYVSPFGTRMSGVVTDSAGLAHVRAIGSDWLVTNFDWQAVEPSRGEYNWSSFDEKVRNAQAAGLEVFVMFTGNPSWAAELRGGPVDHIDDLVNISSRMAERYDCDGVDDAPGSPCVHYWSFYAEPDNTSLQRAERGWGYWGHNPTGYADMLVHVANTIHAANDQAQVLIGGLAYEFREDGTGSFARSFLPETLNALSGYPGGIRAYLDAVAFHYYPINWSSIRDKALDIRGIMERHGVGDLELICPEAAYWSSPRHGSSESTQANRVLQMYVRGESVGMWFLAWYRIYDSAEAESEQDEYPDRTAGLVTIDGYPKLAYHAYQTMTDELHGAQYRRTLGQPGVEGYVFRMPNGAEKNVLWATGDPVNVPFSYRCLRRVNATGAELTIADGDQTNDLDGLANGQVTIRIYTDEPLYVGPCP